MNRLELLKQKLGQSVDKKPEITWVNIELPYALKEWCKVKFRGKIKWNSFDNCWCVSEEVAPQFERVYLDEYKYPTTEQKKILRNIGATYDKNEEVYFLFKFQADDTDIQDDM
jgi:hypothetical protein